MRTDDYLRVRTFAGPRARAISSRVRYCLAPVQQILRLLKIGFACIAIDCLLALLIKLLSLGCQIACFIFQWLFENV